MTSSQESAMPHITAYYNEGREQHRLVSGASQLECVRTQELLLRFLPPPPAVILDIGGGAGIYSFWLASLGFSVHLIDAMPLHIEQARQVASEPGTPPLARMEIGDARHLDFADESADAVLLMGPLYSSTIRGWTIMF